MAADALPRVVGSRIGSKLVGNHHALYVDETLNHSDSLPWVLIWNWEEEAKATGSLNRPSDRDIHL
jgi:hypothetical protein